jgi:prolyl-tRNA editing enzyme YbaK/EbsC (Cys-tRNA(Pro) deacylase)
VLEVTGYVVGSVSPFGLPQPVPVLIDEQVLSQEEVSIGSGVRGTTIFITTADLRNALPDAQTGRFGKA